MTSYSWSPFLLFLAFSLFLARPAWAGRDIRTDRSKEAPAAPRMGSLALLRNRVSPEWPGCSRKSIASLAGSRYWRFSPAPAETEVRLIRFPPRVQGRGGITVTGSRGISPHSSSSKGHDAPEQPTVQFAIRLCRYSMASSRGGVKRFAAIARLSLLPRPFGSPL